MTRRTYIAPPGSKLVERPGPPTTLSNNPPDIVLNLTHEQASFVVENCDANTRMCLAMIMGIEDEKIPLELKREKAEKIVAMQKKFNEIRDLLFKAGAKRKEEDE